MNILSTSLKSIIFTIITILSASVFCSSLSTTAFAENSNTSALLADASNPFGLDTRLQTDASTTDDLQTSVVSIVNYLLGFLGLALLIIIIYSGVKIIFSDGDEEAVSGARTTIIYALLGLAVIVLSWTLVEFIVGVATGGA